MSAAVIGQTLIDGILVGGVYSTIAIGLSLAFGLMRIMNWAHGEFLMVAMYIAFETVIQFGIDPYLSLLITAPIMFLIGFFLQKVIFNRMLDKDSSREPLSILLFTAGLGIFLSNISQVIFTSKSIAVNTKYTSTTIKLGSIIISKPKLISFVIAMIVTLLLYIIIQRPEFGRALRATAQNRQVAQLMGINHKMIYALAFGIGLAITGLSGSLLVPNASVYPTVGNTYSNKCFIIVVLGGKGSIPGCLIGGILIGLIEKFGALFWTEAYAQVVVFALFILTLLFRPSGLMGKEST